MVKKTYEKPNAELIDFSKEGIFTIEESSGPVPSVQDPDNGAGQPGGQPTQEQVF